MIDDDRTENPGANRKRIFNESLVRCRGVFFFLKTPVVSEGQFCSLQVISRSSWSDFIPALIGVVSCSSLSDLIPWCSLIDLSSTDSLRS